MNRVSFGLGNMLAHVRHYLNQCWLFGPLDTIQWMWKNKQTNFHSRKCILKCRLQTANHFSRINLSTHTMHISKYIPHQETSHELKQCRVGKRAYVRWQQWDSFLWMSFSCSLKLHYLCITPIYVVQLPWVTWIKAVYEHENMSEKKQLYPSKHTT